MIELIPNSYGNFFKQVIFQKGWHNRFRVLLGKSHPSFYAFLEEMKNEQADKDTMLHQITLGRPVRKATTNYQINLEKRLFNNIFKDYAEYEKDNNLITFLKNIANIV